MKASYDREADASSIWLSDSGFSVDSGSVLEDIVFDYDADDRIIGIEILNASLHLPCEALRSNGDMGGSMILTVHHAVDTDSLEVRFANDAPVKDEKVSEGVALAYDAVGRIVAIEFKPASKLVSPAALKAVAVN